jgi:signal recognition particle GTPase
MEETFLSDLNNINYSISEKKEYEKEQKLLLKEQERERKEQEKEKKRQEKEADKLAKQYIKEQEKQKKMKPKEDDENSIFNPTQIIGRDKRILLQKIAQYKNLFPEELKGFKIKKNPTCEDLNVYIDEMDSIISTSNVDTFLTESILASIKMIEGVSAFTKNYNISGLADLLKANKQFHQLAKQLYLKYGVFEKTPPETQMIFLIATTAYICKCKNSKKAELEAFLNEPLEQM